MRRLARSVNERAELVLRLRQADEAIVERLPDPLVVLDSRGGPLREALWTRPRGCGRLPCAA